MHVRVLRKDCRRRRLVVAQTPLEEGVLALRIIKGLFPINFQVVRRETRLLVELPARTRPRRLAALELPARL